MIARFHTPWVKSDELICVSKNLGKFSWPESEQKKDHFKEFKNNI